MKICKSCHTEKDSSQFTKCSNNRDGLFHRCKPCDVEFRARRKIEYNNRCMDCDALIYPKPSIRRCKVCSNSGERASAYKNGRTKNAEGYVRLSGHKGHPNATKTGVISEHTLVMSQFLGRPLIKGENVHHKNGVRDDNRLENLELWSTNQPKGQRVTDKVAWARQILSLYGDLIPLEGN